MPDRDREVLDLAVVACPTLLRDTDAPELAGARGLLAAEESFFPLGLPVVVLDSRDVMAGLAPDATPLEACNHWVRAIEAGCGELDQVPFLAFSVTRHGLATGCRGSSTVHYPGGSPCGIVLDTAPMPDGEDETRRRKRAWLASWAGVVGAVDPPLAAMARRAIADASLPAFVSSGPGTDRLRATAAHELGHRRCVQSLGYAGTQDATHGASFRTALGTRVLGLGPLSLYGATSPGEHVAEAYAAWCLGTADAGNAALVTGMRECVMEGRTWEP